VGLVHHLDLEVRRPAPVFLDVVVDIVYVYDRCCSGCRFHVDAVQNSSPVEKAVAKTVAEFLNGQQPM
jgi:hypothetical protein